MEYKLDKATLTDLFYNPEGPIGRYLQEKADTTAAAMIALIESSPPDGYNYTRLVFSIPPYVRKARSKKASENPDSEDYRTLPHQASAGGDAPRDWMGGLIASIYPGRVESRGTDAASAGRFSSMSVRVNVDAGYAVYLEKGWHNAEPRPFMEPALDIAFGEGAGNTVLGTVDEITAAAPWTSYPHGGVVSE